MPQVHESEALLLRRVELGEADLIVTLFTQTLGRVSALARGARRSSKRTRSVKNGSSAPPRTPEPEAWVLLERLLDRLAAADSRVSPERELCELGLPLLAAFGWGIDFERCVSCGKLCPAGAPATIDAQRGGLVCRECGGGRLRLNGALRERLARASRGEVEALAAEDVGTALDLIDRVFSAHAGLE